jgi:adenylate kinase
MEQRLSLSNIEEGFILDGFPRSTGQAEALDRMLNDRKVKLDAVLFVELEDQVIVNRLSKRRSCPVCGAVYHLEHNPPGKEGVCDVCGSGLVQRGDDVEAVILRRLEVYRELTKPLLERYEAKGLVKTISGEMPLHRIDCVLRGLFKTFQVL